MNGNAGFSISSPFHCIRSCLIFAPDPRSRVLQQIWNDDRYDGDNGNDDSIDDGNDINNHDYSWYAPEKRVQ